jgi:hypothetical protein
MRFAFHGKTAAQVLKSLKVTISNATGGAVITAATATAHSLSGWVFAHPTLLSGPGSA